MIGDDQGYLAHAEDVALAAQLADRCLHLEQVLGRNTADRQNNFGLYQCDLIQQIGFATHHFCSLRIAVRRRSGNSYYRLRVTDLNGNCIFSEVAAIFINAESAGITIYPNPVVDVLFIKSVGENQKAVLTIIDGSGKKLKFVNVALINNVVQQIPVNNLSRGLYNLQIETKIGTETKNFIKQ